jgi:hypothetical protein
MDKDLCKQHARVDASILRSETLFEKIFDTLQTKASNATIKWGLGLFIGIMIAVIGFVWANVRLQEDRFFSNQVEIIKKLDELKK